MRAVEIITSFNARCTLHTHVILLMFDSCLLMLS